LNLETISNRLNSLKLKIVTFNKKKKMGTADIKTELSRLIQDETDHRVLEAIYILLKKTSLNPELKEKLTSRALKSEEDIKEGRLYSKVELESKLKEQLGL